MRPVAKLRGLRFGVVLFAASLLSSRGLNAQAPHVLTDADKQKIESLIHGMTLEQKIDYIGGTGFAVRAMPSLGLPAFEMSDGPYGTRSNAGFPSTTYAAGIGLAASWDRELAVRVGAGIGRDARARGVHYMLGPGVNIYRSPRNGRNFEYFGEDPFLTSAIAVGYIDGMQAQGVSATIKHYLGNNSEFLRHDSDSIIDERALRELYLPSFEAAVKKAHVGAMMDSYNLINGQHATQNSYLNTEIVRREWKYPGVMMSDWLATYDGVAAANGGLDLEMPEGKFMNRKSLLPAIKAGTLKEAVLDEKIRHILSTAMAFGWLDRPQTDTTISYVDARNKAAALDSARESAVLLKNEGHVLPLNKAQLKTILVVGPEAYPGVPVGGGSAGVVPFHQVSDVEGLTTALGPGVNVLYDRGLPTLAELARTTDFMTEKNGGKPGVTVETFATSDLSGAPTTKVSPHINVAGSDWQSMMEEDPAALMALFTSGEKRSSHRYTGYYTPAASGKYLVTLEGTGENSGSRVYLDDKLIIDNWKIVRAFQPYVQLELSAGPHKVVVEDYQKDWAGGHIRLSITDVGKIVSARAIELAGKADVVVVAAGYQSENESEGGDRTWGLPFGQDELIEAMAAANHKTIVSVSSGGGIDFNGWLDRVPAVLENWYAGQEGGTALAELLLGEVNPSGHLPASFEKHAEDNPTYHNYYPDGDTNRVMYKEGIFVGYRGYEHNHVKPLFPFGFGLSYTTFKFADLKVLPGTTGARVSFTVTNTGPVAGAEVAQVYISEMQPRLPRPERELKGFERVVLAAGETKNVTVELDPRAFAFYDVAQKKWRVNPGKFGVEVGDSVESADLKGSLDVSAEIANAVD